MSKYQIYKWRWDQIYKYEQAKKEYFQKFDQIVRTSS